VKAPAPAKINLALVVGPLRDNGKHELERQIDLNATECFSLPG